MRKDPSLDLARGATERAVTIGASELSDGASLSGHERNHLFVNDGTGVLTDVSGVSGLDDPADGRAVAWLDFDRDGWLDFAVTNANAPTLQLYRNRMADLPAAGGRSAIAVRLVGGNRSATSSSEWSSRDGVGARVEIDVEGRTLVRELRAGEGFAAQNSSVLHAGIGAAEEAKEIRVRWPSGRVQSTGPVPAGHRVTVYENPEEAPSGSAIVVESPAPAGTPATAYRPDRELLGLSEAFGAPQTPLRVLTSTATWCESCRGELPDVARLREAFSEEELDLVAIPVDENDSPEKLREYVATYSPRYRMISDRSPSDVERVQQIIQGSLRRDVLPASIVTDAGDRILGVYWGLPTVSDLRALGMDSRDH